MSERSLIAFTIMSQTAVGAFVTLGALYTWARQTATMGSTSMLIDPILLVIGLLTILSLLVSFFHLGSPLNAWRAFANLRTSWLSREILFAVLFTGLGATFAAARWLNFVPITMRDPLGWATALCGLALVYSMARVYMLRTIPPWNTWITLAAFFCTAFLLGGLIIGLAWAIHIYTLPSKFFIRLFGYSHTWLTPLHWIGLGALVLLCLQIFLISLGAPRQRSAGAPRQGIAGTACLGGAHNDGSASAINNPREHITLWGLRIVLIFLAMVSITWAFPIQDIYIPSQRMVAAITLALLLVLLSEILSRYLFYQALESTVQGL